MRGRQMPAIFDRHEAKAEAQSSSGQRRDALGKIEHIADADDGRAGQRCHGVEIGTQYLRSPAKQNPRPFPAGGSQAVVGRPVLPVALRA
jgi:hypothetical protein